LNKASYLADPDVREMLSWLREQFEPNGRFTHTYTDRRSRQSWQCDGLHHAFTSYRWNDKPWAENKRVLDDFRLSLRDAVANGDEAGAFNVSRGILRWGGVWANNGPHLEKRRAEGVLLSELKHLAGVLSSPNEPSRSDLLRVAGDKSTMCRMNAGFVKIYSVLLDEFVIYDGRVGAALGLIVRQFCEQTERDDVPEALRFASGSPKEAAKAAAPKTRNPSLGSYRFPKLRRDCHFHSLQAMRASSLLQATLEGHCGRFSSGEAGFHELAAALCMVGYDLPRRSAAAK